MDVIVDRCAGLDVHKRTVVACVRTTGAERRKRDRVVRTFEAFTDDLVKRFHSAASGLGLALDGTGRDVEAMSRLCHVEVQPVQAEQHCPLACGQGILDGEHFRPNTDFDCVAVSREASSRRGRRLLLRWRSRTWFRTAR